jgi:predicted nucleotidyltransferase
MAAATINDDVLKHITDTIVEHFHPRRIILFGSRARGEAKPDSDYDVLVEMETELSFYERLWRIHDLFRRRKWAMDVVAFTPSEMQAEREKALSIANIAESEGTTLYDAR